MITSAGFILGLLAVATAQAVPDSLPNDWLHGDTLVVHHRGFSVVGPRGWVWTHATVTANNGITGEAFVVTAPDSSAATAVVIMDTQVWGVGGEAFSRGLLKGMVEGLPEGWSAEDLRTSRTETPLPQTLRYRARLVSTEGDTLYQFGYLVSGRKGYLLTTRGSTEVEPPSFSETVRSFTLLISRRPALVPAALAIGRPRHLLFGLLAFFVLIELFIRVQSRAAPPPLTFVSRLLLVLGVTGSLFLTQVEVMPTEAWDPSPSAIGYVTGILAFAAGLAYFAYGRVAKRNWNKFARAFCLLALILPFLAAAGKLSR